MYVCVCLCVHPCVCELRHFRNNTCSRVSAQADMEWGMHLCVYVLVSRGVSVCACMRVCISGNAGAHRGARSRKGYPSL